MIIYILKKAETICYQATQWDPVFKIKEFLTVSNTLLTTVQHESHHWHLSFHCLYTTHQCLSRWIR